MCGYVGVCPVWCSLGLSSHDSCEMGDPFMWLTAGWPYFLLGRIDQSWSSDDTRPLSKRTLCVSILYVCVFSISIFNPSIFIKWLTSKAANVVWYICNNNRPLSSEITPIYVWNICMSLFFFYIYLFIFALLLLLLEQENTFVKYTACTLQLLLYSFSNNLKTIQKQLLIIFLNCCLFSNYAFSFWLFSPLCDQKWNYTDYFPGYWVGHFRVMTTLV